MPTIEGFSFEKEGFYTSLILFYNSSNVLTPSIQLPV
jgi:hypothetical protein